MHRADSVTGHLGLGRSQHAVHDVKIHVVTDTAVGENPVSVQTGRRTADLHTVDHDIVPVVEGSRQPHAPERKENRPGQLSEREAAILGKVGDHRVVDVAEIMIDGAPAGRAADDLNALRTRVAQIDLVLGDLVLSDDDGSLIAPQQKDRV